MHVLSKNWDKPSARLLHSYTLVPRAILAIRFMTPRHFIVLDRQVQYGRGGTRAGVHPCGSGGTNAGT